MKRLMLGLLAIMMVGLSGCGDGSVTVLVPVTPVVYAPSISLNSFTKDVVNEFIDGSVSFNAPDSDIDTMTVVAISPGGNELSRTVTLINLPAVIQGTIPFSIDYHLFPSSTFAYTFSIYLTDFNGNTSNQAVATFFVP